MYEEFNAAILVHYKEKDSIEGPTTERVTIDHGTINISKLNQHLKQQTGTTGRDIDLFRITFDLSPNEQGTEFEKIQEEIENNLRSAEDRWECLKVSLGYDNNY